MSELKFRDLQHEIELSQMERKLAEYIGLIREREIKAEEDLHRALRGFRLKGLEKWGYKEPPKMRRIMPGATTDWDFRYTNWNLDTVIFVSAPSSLNIDVDAGYILNAVLCKYAGTYPLDQGRIVTQIRIPDSLSNIYAGSYRFRSNSAPGVTADSATADAYILYECIGDAGARNNATIQFGYVSGGAFTQFAVNSYLANGAPTLNAFDKRRITWWVSAGVLIVRLERWFGGAWIKAIDDISDAANRFTGNANRRCGFDGRARACRVDDTEIWGP